MTSMRKPVASVRPLIVPASKLSPVPKPAFSMVNFEPPLDLHQAADVLGVHWKTLEGMARDRKIPAFKVGKRWRFRLSSLNEWLENGIKSNTTDQAAVTGEEQHP